MHSCDSEVRNNCLGSWLCLSAATALWAYYLSLHLSQSSLSEDNDVYLKGLAGTDEQNIVAIIIEMICLSIGLALTTKSQTFKIRLCLTDFSNRTDMSILPNLGKSPKLEKKFSSEVVQGVKDPMCYSMSPSMTQLVPSLG